MKLPSNVLFARNVLIGMALFLLVVTVWMLMVEPLKWENYLPMLAGSVYVFNIVRQVNRGEGGWTDLVGLRHTTRPDPTPGPTETK